MERESTWLQKQKTIVNERQQKSLSRADRIAATLANAKRIEQEKEAARLAAIEERAHRERNRFHKNMQIGQYKSQLTQQKNEIYFSKVNNSKIEKQYETLQKVQNINQKNAVSQQVFEQT